MFLLKILFLFFPGIVSCYLIEILTESKPKNSLQKVLNIFVLGVISYTPAYIICKIINCLLKTISMININKSWISLNLDFSNVKLSSNFVNYLFNNQNSLAFWEILLATISAIIIGLVITKIIQFGLIHKFAQKYNISHKFSDSTVWGYVFNSKDISPWITVRDIRNDLIFCGCLRAFSAENKNNELFLTNVNVYRNSNGVLLYNTYGLYITRPENDITIEFFEPPQGGGNNGK